MKRREFLKNSIITISAMALLSGCSNKMVDKCNGGNNMRVLLINSSAHKNGCTYTALSEVAKVLNQNPLQVFKTLVTTGKSGSHYVFMLPAEKELDLKKAAHAVGEKSVEMLKSKELLPLTGYVHGGCSPIGMKKFFTTTVDSSAQNFDTIIFSAGKIGYQVEMPISQLHKVIKFGLADITA